MFIYVCRNDTQRNTKVVQGSPLDNSYEIKKYITHLLGMKLSTIIDTEEI